jgi:heptosyltransferase-1
VPPRSVLIIRLSAIGDVVMASPLIDALKRTWPGVRVSWLVEPQARGVLEHHPDLDRLLVWPKAEWKRLLRSGRLIALARSVRGFLRELRAIDADLALDLQGLLKSGVWARLSGAGERIGLGSREGSARFMTRVLPRAGDPALIGSEYRFLAETLGLDLGEFRMRVGVAPADIAFARDWAAANAPDGHVVLCPFTTRPQKHWFEDRWAVLAARLRDDLGLVPVLLGGPADRAAAQRIVAATAGGLADLTGRTSIPQAAAMIGAARLLIGVDTGLSHMGPACDVPTVALFGSTCPYTHAGRPNARVIYHRLDCSPCRRHPTCDGRFDCMRAIGVDEVLDRARELAR